MKLLVSNICQILVLNQITSFQYFPDSVNNLYCDKNQFTIFQHISDSVTKLNCYNNQIVLLNYIVVIIKLLISNIW